MMEERRLAEQERIRNEMRMEELRNQELRNKELRRKQQQREEPATKMRRIANEDEPQGGRKKLDRNTTKNHKLFRDATMLWERHNGQLIIFGLVLLFFTHETSCHVFQSRQKKKFA